MEQRIMKLAKTRPDMACLFQVVEKVYPRFTVYRVYVACYGLNHITSYTTTELKEDLIHLDKGDKDLNAKIKESGYEPEDNIIFAFFLEN